MARMDEPVRLRRLAERDLGTLHRWYQTPSLWDHLVGEFAPREEAESVAYMRQWLTPTPTELRLAVERTADGALIGLVALSPIDPAAGEAEFHVFLGDEGERGRGYGRAATAAMLAHAFDALALWRVHLKVLKTNEAALRLYATLGFEPAPDSGQTAMKRGAAVSVVAMDLTDAMFRQRQRTYAPRRSATR
jgi:RimJ/RimL family protein N-acetyltransferase